MVATSKISKPTPRDLFYYRRRAQNRAFEALLSFFAEEADRRGITKKDLAIALDKDPAQISRWLNAPSNFTIDTMSDILLALDAELDWPIIRFAERPTPNEMHPLISEILTPKIEVSRPPSSRAASKVDSPSTTTKTNATTRVLESVR